MSIFGWIIVVLIIVATGYIAYGFGARNEARWWRAETRRKQGLPPEEKP